MIGTLSEVSVATRPNIPIFVVGAPRSGTTLLAAMLGAHPRLSCGPETHFYIELAKCEDPDGVVAAENWPRSAMRLLDATRPEGESVYQQYGLDPADLENRLAGKPPSRRAILESLTAHHCRAIGKRRWIEKTPDHLLHIAQIRRDFPMSPIVRIVRDPRDVCLSLLKVSWRGAPSNLARALLRWKKLYDTVDPVLQGDANTHTLRYEDLVLEPDVQLKKLCRSLGEEFDHQMLDTSQSSRHLLSSTNASWHPLLGKPLDRDRLGVWKREMSKEENWLAEAIVGDYLLRFGYARRECLDCYARVFPSLNRLVDYADALSARKEARSMRFWNVGRRERPRGLVCLGHPEDLDWLGSGDWGRRGRAMRCSAMTLGAALRRRRVIWLCQGRPKTTTKCGALVARLLRRADTR